MTNATWVFEHNFLSQAENEQERIIIFTHVSTHYRQRSTGSQPDYLPTAALQAITSSNDTQ